MNITRIEQGAFSYYECTFKGGNLLTFSIFDMIEQLVSIYGFRSQLFNYSLN